MPGLDEDEDEDAAADAGPAGLFCLDDDWELLEASDAFRSTRAMFDKGGGIFDALFLFYLCFRLIEDDAA